MRIRRRCVSGGIDVCAGRIRTSVGHCPRNAM